MAAYIKPRFWAATTDYSTNIANVIAQKTEIAQLIDDVALLNSTYKLYAFGTVQQCSEKL